MAEEDESESLETEVEQALEEAKQSRRACGTGD